MINETSGDEPQPGTSTAQQQYYYIGQTQRSVSLTEAIPKKGILKRSSLRTPNESRDSVPVVTPFRPSPDRFPDKPSTRIPKLSVTWWEKNAVAIFGDTSDENNTDSEQVMKDLGAGPRSRSVEGEDVRQTAILDSEEDSEDATAIESDRLSQVCSVPMEIEEEINYEDQRDDAISITSSTGSASSSVVGRWWTGKDTRFVPHCQKRGCNHGHHNPELGVYLTPTQRRNKEMAELKKELRSAKNEVEEKNRHLSELREKLKEIENVHEVKGHLSDSSRLMQHEREAREDFEKEKKLMERKHAVRVNQLVQETLNAREQIAKLKLRIEELESIINRPRVEASTLTDDIQNYDLGSHTPGAGPQSPTDPTDPSTSALYVQSPSLPSSPTAVNPLSPVGSLPERRSIPMLSQASPLMHASPMSISMDSKISGNPMYLSQEALNHMQAYQNEAFIWRNKAAQLEIVLKDQLLKYSSLEKAYRNDIETARSEVNITRKISGTTVIPSSAVSSFNDNGADNVTLNSQHLISQHSPHMSVTTSTTECVLAACADRKKSLIEENNKLLDTMKEANTRIQELEEDVSALRKEVEALLDSKARLEGLLKGAEEETETKRAEVEAANLVNSRLQNDKETMKKAISFMEERIQVYRNALMEHELVISDESYENWRKGFNDPRYSVMVCKKMQTELTAESLSKHETEFQSTKRKLEELNNEFTANRSDLHDRFEEIEKILLTKTELVDVLSKQLEDIRRQQRHDIEEHQKEREVYKKSLSEISEVAERVPILEMRIDELNKERSEVELKFREQKEEYEDGLETTLAESLKKYREQSEYWQNKVQRVEDQLNKSKDEIILLQRDKEEQKLRMKLEKAELEQKLTSSIDHVTTLHKQLTKSQRDAEVEARPRQVSKYVACRPITKSKSTLIEKGDLFNETEERLKLCQGELQTTRRQVHILQQKLVTTIQEKTDGRSTTRRRIACVVPKNEEIPVATDSDKEEVKALQSRNADLREKLMQAEDEKESLVRKERDRIQRIANEFENVRRELDQEIGRYESEKKWLKTRIQNLEQDNEQLQKQLEVVSTTSGRVTTSTATSSIMPNTSRDSLMEDDHIALRKTYSEPELVLDDEMSKIIDESVLVSKELSQNKDNNEETTATASTSTTSKVTASMLSPAFATLADDLSMVKSDLEQILNNWEEDEGREKVRTSRTRSPSRVMNSEEPLHSEVLDTVMMEWDTDEKLQLARELKRSRQERDSMKLRIDRLSRDLRSATAELEVFRREPNARKVNDDNEAIGNDGRLVRSRSVVDLFTEPDHLEARRWKEKCGTMFRELNSMRTGYKRAQEERRELKIQLAMMRGEMELLRCQTLQSDLRSCTEQPMSPTSFGSSSVYFSPKSARSVASLYDSKPRKEKIIVHESPAAFRKGSTREAVACTIQTPILSTRRSQEQSVGTARTRSHSGPRRKVIASREELEAKEQRRSTRRKSMSYYATAPQSLSSSMTSLQQEAGIAILRSKPPLPDSMSQSWHEPSTSNRFNLNASYPSVNDITISQDTPEDDMNRTNSRVISLREKVGKLTRENKSLNDQMNDLKQKTLALEQKAGYRSGIDVERLNRIEEEKEVLRQQVEMLLRKVQELQDLPSPPNPSEIYLEEQLNFSRQQNDMYERKIQEMEQERSEMYLVMFKKGQEAVEHGVQGAEEKDIDKISQDRIVLKFLHDAFYYFLLNKGDSREHLQAIMTMLDFTSNQKDEVMKRRGKT
ncbi:unnamed protein product [Auanema sp. JU1783]|nr:unnamed protein product [Auanema sp. JU1783]